jgi:hypothetical protein
MGVWVVHLPRFGQSSRTARGLPATGIKARTNTTLIRLPEAVSPVVPLLPLLLLRQLKLLLAIEKIVPRRHLPSDIGSGKTVTIWAQNPQAMMRSVRRWRRRTVVAHLHRTASRRRRRPATARKMDPMPVVLTTGIILRKPPIILSPYLRSTRLNHCLA